MAVILSPRGNEASNMMNRPQLSYVKEILHAFI
ncbi:unknown [Clostridium sp. CAG:127]|nr:unknown [Clostridium sp. CAG:127]